MISNRIASGSSHTAPSNPGGPSSGGCTIFAPIDCRKQYARVDVGVFARAEAYLMQADAALHEVFAAAGFVASHDPRRCAQPTHSPPSNSDSDGSLALDFVAVTSRQAQGHAIHRFYSFPAARSLRLVFVFGFRPQRSRQICPQRLLLRIQHHPPKSDFLRDRLRARDRAGARYLATCAENS